MIPIVTVIRDLASSVAKDAFRRAFEEWQRIETPPGDAPPTLGPADREATAKPTVDPRAGLPDRRDPARQAHFRASAETPERRAAPSPAASAGQPVSQPAGPDAGAHPRTLFATRTAVVERMLAAENPHAAAQELYTVLRTLPPGLAGAFVAGVQPQLAAIVAGLCDRSVADAPGVGRMAVTIEHPARTARDAAPPGASPGFGSAATTRALANVASILDAGAGTAEVRTFARDLGAIVLAGKNANDAAIFFGLAQAVAVGTGLLLPLTLAAQLEERGDRRRRQSLIALLAASIRRLGGRIDGVDADILEIAGPLLMEWTSWRSKLDGENLVAMLQAFLTAYPDVLPNLAEGLARFERAGRDAVRVLDDLSRGPPDPELRDARSLLLASDAAQRTIAGSLAAHRHVRTLALQREGESGLTLEAVQLVFTNIGFPLDRAAFLAEQAWLTQPELPLGSGWTGIESLEAIRGGGEAFQRLLAYLNGRFVVPARIDLVDFSDIDPIG